MSVDNNIGAALHQIRSRIHKQGSVDIVLPVYIALQIIIPVMGFMFVLSAVSVIIQVGSFKLRGKRVFRMAPLHHHFEKCGMKETQIVLMYTVVTLVLTALAVISVIV